MREVFLITTIDTEEDNWGDLRAHPELSNIGRLPELATFLEAHGVAPTYLIDYPVATDPGAVEILGKIHADGRSEIGAHLHPWCNPPLREGLTPRESMLKNLSEHDQRAKLEVLTAAIEAGFGARPTSFRAGRWGLGCRTAGLLLEQGYRVETSVTPFVSWEGFDDGPSFERHPWEPYWMNAQGQRVERAVDGCLLEVPVSIGFSRPSFDLWRGVHRWMGMAPLRPLRLRGIAHHLGLLQKIWLSPEISSAGEMLRLARVLVSKDIDVLNLTFHSPSLKPGLTPFIGSESDLKVFYGKLAEFLDRLPRFAKVTSVTLNEYYRTVVGTDAAGGSPLA